MSEHVDRVLSLRELKEGDCVKSEGSSCGLKLRLVKICIPSFPSQGFGNVSIKMLLFGLEM